MKGYLIKQVPFHRAKVGVYFMFLLAEIFDPISCRQENGKRDGLFSQWDSWRESRLRSINGIGEPLGCSQPCQTPHFT